jgi:hypothetical protein
MIWTRPVPRDIDRKDMTTTAETPANARYDRVIVLAANGERKSFTREEFDALPLRERVNYLIEGRAQFFLRGEEVSAHEAMKR